MEANAIKSKLNNELIMAPCGMNCSVCMAYLRSRNKCTGCRGIDDNKPITRTKCRIKTCSHLKEEGIDFCYKCADYPCERLKHLDKRYSTKYNMSMIDNLEVIKKGGLGKFIRNENKKWTCSKCGGTICVHKGYCINCGELRRDINHKVQ